MFELPAHKAALAPQTDFQDLTRAQGLRMHAEIPLPLLAPPLLHEILALITKVPDQLRAHSCYDGSWSSIGLAYGTSNGHSEMTAWMADVPTVSALLEHFGGCTGFCTIARISPGDLLNWHTDPLSIDSGTVRLHLPVTTNSDAVTDFCHERAFWPAGTLHYGDYGFPHRVFNTGDTERIHLYFDVAAQTVAKLLPEPLSSPRHEIRSRAIGLLQRHRHSHGNDGCIRSTA